MPVPDFSPGEVLTAAAMDSIGLWLVSTTTIGTGVTSVPVNNCFSSNYQNYRVVINTSASASGNSAFITLNGSAGATYFGGGSFQAWSATSNTVPSFNGVTSGFWLGVTGPGFTFTGDILRPNLAAATGFNGLSSGAGFGNTLLGYDSNAASSVSFTLSILGGPTLTGGTIRVYGYRN